MPGANWKRKADAKLSPLKIISPSRNQRRKSNPCKTRPPQSRAPKNRDDTTKKGAARGHAAGPDKVRTAPVALNTCAKSGRYVIAVKAVGIFGNETMTLVPVTVG
jgi:hypothetical protein